MDKENSSAPTDIIGLGNNAAVTIQKSTPLLSLWRSELTLPEFKILDTYLARINSHDPSRRNVRFEKGELEQILGVREIKASVLKQRLKNLGMGVEIEDPTVPEGFITIFLFEKIQGGLDENGLWQVELQCTEAARKYIFNIENIGYLRYRLQEIVRLHSRYSYILFLYLEQNRFRESWTIGLDSLRELLHCDQVPLYQTYGRFNDKVLKRAQRELLELNGYVFSYEPVKTGRRVTGVRFTVPGSADALAELKTAESESAAADDKTPGALTDPEIRAAADIDAEPVDAGNRAFILSGCIDATGKCPFSAAEQAQILAVLSTIPPERLPGDWSSGDSLSCRWRAYLEERCAQLRRMSENTEIRNPFAYFLKMLKADAARG